MPRMPSERPRLKRGLKPLDNRATARRECWRQIEAQSIPTGVSQMIVGCVRYFVGIARIARQHRNSAQELRAL